MDDLTCPTCNYQPGEFPRSDVREFLEHAGYENDWLGVRYGPDQDGLVVICPLCGGVAGRDEPENHAFLIPESETFDINGPDSNKIDEVEMNTKWRTLMPEHIKPAEGEPQTCAECGTLIQPSDYHFSRIDTEIDETVWFCSDECNHAYFDE